MSEPNPHPAAELLGRFADGALPAREGGEVVRHLLAGCGDCARQLQQRMGPPRSSEGVTMLAAERGTSPAARARAAAARARAEADAAPALISELEALASDAARERAA